MLTILLACSALTTPAAQSGSKTVALQKLEVFDNGAAFEAELSKLAPVIVACENSTGAVRFGPSDDPRISMSWSDEDGGRLVVGVDDSFVDCHVWTFR